MAEREQGTQESTARNRERARESGQVPRSRDLSAAAVLLATALALKFLGPYLGGALRALLIGGLSIARVRALGDADALNAVLKAAADGFLVGAPLWRHAPLMASLGTLTPAQAAQAAGGLISDTFVALTATVAVLAAVDVPWQLWQYARRLRMTRNEVREEMRETEGSPEMKNRIRSIQRELARRRMIADVPKADVVVVNPSHYAVALRYVEARMRAPIVVAKGLDLVAARIRAVAEQHHVPIVEAAPLARALHRHVEIGAEIPAALYVAVAQVLTYLAQLRQAARLGQAAPLLPTLSLEGVDA